VADLKTFSNNLDASLTGAILYYSERSFFVVYIISKTGKPLMPTKRLGRVRHLLKDGLAKVVQRTPFTIQLLYESEEYTQPITLGIDSGYQNIGVSVVTEKEEVFSAEVKLRTDIIKLNSERRAYRRTRRNRKTWHRKLRFLNRKKDKGWLAPSIQHKIDSHIKLVDMVKRILPITKINVEVASFDIQKIKNPDIEGVNYQNGAQLGFWNVREYVLHRDGHICRHCKGKSGDKILNVHHLKSRQTGGDRPENLITLCSNCHQLVSKGKLKLNIKVSSGLKAETFMTMIRWRIVNLLRQTNTNVSHTYGYLTKCKRIAFGISKSHVNDAFVIACGTIQQRMDGYAMQQVRKCNRKLYKGIRSHIKNTAPRLVFGFQRFDKVLWKGIECFVFGRRTRGYFDIRRLDGTKLNTDVKYTELTLLETFRTFLTERKVGNSSPA